MKKFIWLVLILPSLACSTTLIKPAAAQINASPFPTEPTTAPLVATTQSATITTPESCNVVAEALHLRDSPNLNGTVIGWLIKGDRLTLLPEPPVDHWIKVKTGDGLTGWINSTYCTTDNP